MIHLDTNVWMIFPLNKVFWVYKKGKRMLDNNCPKYMFLAHNTIWEKNKIKKK